MNFKNELTMTSIVNYVFRLVNLKYKWLDS